MEFRERRFVISNRLGLHARAAVQRVKAANQFRSDIWVAVNDTHVNGKSVMGLLTLAASQRASLVVTCEGDGTRSPNHGLTGRPDGGSPLCLAARVGANPTSGPPYGEYA